MISVTHVTHFKTRLLEIFDWSWRFIYFNFFAFINNNICILAHRTLSVDCFRALLHSLLVTRQVYFFVGLLGLKILDHRVEEHVRVLERPAVFLLFLSQAIAHVEGLVQVSVFCFFNFYLVLDKDIEELYILVNAGNLCAVRVLEI